MKMKRKRGLPIKVMRPRGYIVAGMSSEFVGRGKEKMEEDFRRLGRSLKNIDFLLDDELLENLKNIKNKLDKQWGRKRSVQKSSENTEACHLFSKHRGSSIDRMLRLSTQIKTACTVSLSKEDGST